MSPKKNPSSISFFSDLYEKSCLHFSRCEKKVSDISLVLRIRVTNLFFVHLYLIEEKKLYNTEKVSDIKNLSLTFFLERILVLEEYLTLDPQIGS